MYVCICNALTDRHVATAAQSGTVRPAEVFAACQCRAQCGGCVKRIVQLLRSEATALEAAVFDADAAALAA